jgi:hypothetical protein
VLLDVDEGMAKEGRKVHYIEAVDNIVGWSSEGTKRLSGVMLG